MPKPRGKLKETNVTLGSDLRISRAREVFAALEAAASFPSVRIDGADVIRIDAAGLQALAAAVVRFRTAGAVWRWHNASPALAGAAKLLGLASVLELQ
ncbi:MAG: STAS domain-containing protein [Burkholderiales bacterium]|nr:STAS domain-containing protein [Burkholderiales bacterium]